MTHAVVTATIEIATSREAVWAVIVGREQGRLWRSADFDTDWQTGSPIAIAAQIGPKRYRDKGTILKVDPPSLLVYEFFPRVSGLPDSPENYSRVTLRLMPSGSGTRLEVEHTVPPSPIRRGKSFEIGPESGEKHVGFYWNSALVLLRDLAEGRDSLAIRMARLAQG